MLVLVEGVCSVRDVIRDKMGDPSGAAAPTHRADEIAYGVKREQEAEGAFSTALQTFVEEEFRCMSWYCYRCR